MPLTLRNTLKKQATEKRGAALVEFAIILLPLSWITIGATDIGMYVLAKHQVSSMANIATHYAATHGVDGANFTAIVRKSILNPITATGQIEISNPSVICGCSATDASAATLCLPDTDAGFQCSLTYDTINFTSGQGRYAIITASADYPVIFPYFWESVMGEAPVNGRLAISITSYVRIN